MPRAGRRRGRRGRGGAGVEDGIVFPRRPTPEQLERLNRYLARLYYDETAGGGYGTPLKLWHEVRRRGYYTNVGLRRIEKFLNGLAPYTLFRPSRGKYPVPPVVVYGPLEQFDMDLVDVSRQADANDGTRFLLTAIDVFTKYAYAVPLTSKQGQVVAEAAEDIFNDRQPKRVCSDRGSEFKSQQFQRLLKDRGIHHFYAGGSGKCTVVERFHRTLKGRIARFQHHRNTERYIDHLQGIVEGYNKTYHRTIKRRPVDADGAEHRADVFHDSYADKPLPRPTSFKLKIGDKVRIAAERHPFLREHFQRWSEEIFEVTRRWRQRNVNMYKIKDCADEPVVGSFYGAELTKVETDENQLYRIERVLDERVDANGVKMVKVKFAGYPERCGEWMPRRNIRAAR